MSPERSTWILTALYCAFLLAAAGYFTIAAVAVLDDGGYRLIPGMWLALACISVGFAVQSVVKAYNGAFWLDGTVLTARRVGGAVRCDLSQASVAMRPGALGFGSPKLVVKSPGIRTITMPLVPNGTTRVLPPRELHALADAVRRAQGAEPVAQELRRLAGAPASGTHDSPTPPG
ncbi:hypothetical protein GCM10010191_67030 [Actinomadura vinacea]|uniref:PH domain-containing protein n=1 Tax=Actinomadura vinacea TaxID=115336 RepID=A0ABN3JV95_9ACTN